MPFLILGALLLSFAPVVVKASQLPPDMTGFWRMLFGVGWLLGLLALQGRLRGSLRLRALPLWAGVLFAVDLIFWHRAIHFIGPGVATLLANLQVLMVGAWGFVSGQDVPSRRFWLAAPLALGGLWLIVGGSTLPREQVMPGLLLGLLASAAYSAYLIYLRKIERQPGSHSAQTLLQVSLAAVLVLGASALTQGENLAIPHLQGLIWLLIYGIVIQGVAWTLIAKAMQQVSGYRASLVLLIQPALALVWDVLIFQRQPSLWEGVGMALTLVAIQLGASQAAPKALTEPQPAPSP
ncbi:MAG: DMT family transporter [Candidatus Sericytochromatia bacterium]